jgi:hypothetical protein
MKRITILCPDGWIDEVREKGMEIFNHQVLKTPVSEDGKFPATYWICTLYVNIENETILKSVQDKSIIVEKSPKEVLKSLNLVKINERNDK